MGEAIKFDLSSVSTKELVEELRKREGVELYQTEKDSLCPLHDFKSAFPATILRITGGKTIPNRKLADFQEE